MDGKPLYEYARQNIPLPKPIESRSCMIYNLELLNFAEGGTHNWKSPTSEIAPEDKAAMERLELMVQQNKPVDLSTIAEKDEAPVASTSALHSPQGETLNETAGAETPTTEEGILLS